MTVSDKAELASGSPQQNDNPNDANGRRVRGMQLGRFRLRYLPTKSPHGFGHDEGDVVARSLIELAVLYEHGRSTSVRLVVGSHSLWLFW